MTSINSSSSARLQNVVESIETAVFSPQPSSSISSVFIYWHHALPAAETPNSLVNALLKACVKHLEDEEYEGRFLKAVKAFRWIPLNQEHLMTLLEFAELTPQLSTTGMQSLRRILESEQHVLRSLSSDLITQRCDMLCSTSTTKICEALTWIEAELLAAVNLRELVEKLWVTSDKQTKAPSTMRMIERFNALSLWTIETIITPEEHSARMACLTKLIDIMNKLIVRFKNFSTSGAILAGLLSVPSRRLRSLWEALPHTFSKKFNDSRRILDPGSNYKGYRNLWKTVKLYRLPAIPHIPALLRDVLYALDSSQLYQSTKSNEADVNYIVHLGELLKMVQRIQKIKYSFTPSEHLVAYFQDVRCDTDLKVLDERAKTMAQRARHSPFHTVCDNVGDAVRAFATSAVDSIKESRRKRLLKKQIRQRGGACSSSELDLHTTFSPPPELPASWTKVSSWESRSGSHTSQLSNRTVRSPCVRPTNSRLVEPAVRRSRSFDSWDSKQETPATPRRATFRCSNILLQRFKQDNSRAKTLLKRKTKRIDEKHKHQADHL